MCMQCEVFEYACGMVQYLSMQVVWLFHYACGMVHNSSSGGVCMCVLKVSSYMYVLMWCVTLVKYSL